MSPKIQRLIQTSEEVLLDCVLENGAIVAANSDNIDYPADANDYRYVWPRDAGFILYALQILGIDKKAEFSQWLLERAESLDTKGLYFRRYATNGASAWYGDAFQPDQAGTLLWSLCAGESSDVSCRVVKKIADGLSRTWGGDSFSVTTNDLWEHMSVAQGHTTFLYTLASCATGLKMASEHPSVSEEDSQTWLTVSKQMNQTLNEQASSHITRTGEDNSNNIDASLLGLVWPFSCVDNLDLLSKTVKEIESKLSDTLGVKRFEGDSYDGILKQSIDQNQGAGAWPLLTFWLAIAQQKIGETEKALHTYEKLLTHIDGYIPEQLFEDDRIGVSPLGWSHAMFVIASKELGLA